MLCRHLGHKEGEAMLPFQSAMQEPLVCNICSCFGGLFCNSGQTVLVTWHLSWHIATQQTTNYNRANRWHTKKLAFKRMCPSCGPTRLNSERPVCKETIPSELICYCCNTKCIQQSANTQTPRSTELPLTHEYKPSRRQYNGATCVSYEQCRFLVRNAV